MDLGVWGRERERTWLQRFQVPNSTRSGAPAPLCEISFQSIARTVQKQSFRLFSYLACCWELGFRVFLFMGVARSGKAGGWGWGEEKNRV